MRIKQLLEILLLGLMWGPSFLLIKWGVEDLSPVTLVAGRIGLGGLLLYVLLKLKGGALPRSLATWGKLAVAGIFASSLPFLLLAYGELRVSSALTGMINGSTPIFTAILAHYWLPKDRLTPMRLIGVAAGVAGFVVLLTPQILQQGLSGNLMGMIAIGVGSISYAVGMVYTRKYVPQLPPLVGPTAMLLVSAAYLVPIALVREGFGVSSLFTVRALASMAMLAVLGTSLAYVLFYRVIRHSGPVALSMALYVMAFSCALLGRYILHEHLAWTAYLAGGLILIGMLIVTAFARPSPSLPQ